MISGNPGFERIIDLFNGFKFITKELIPDGPEQPFYFASALRNKWWGMDQINSVPGTKDLQVPADICRSIVHIKTLGNSKSSDRPHEIIN